MTVTPSYIPGPGQTDQQAATRAAALGVGIAPRTVPPVYASAATNLPGVVAEYGLVVFAHDDGTLTAQQVTNLVAPLVAQQTADATLSANLSTLQQRATAALAANATSAATNATFLALGATPTAVQVRDQVIILTNQANLAIKELNAIIRITQNMVANITDTA